MITLNTIYYHSKCIIHIIYKYAIHNRALVEIAKSQDLDGWWSSIELHQPGSHSNKYFMKRRKKLDGVGPVDNKPSTD